MIVALLENTDASVAGSLLRYMKQGSCVFLSNPVWCFVCILVLVAL